MPHYRERLLSAWPNDRVFEVGQPAANVEIPNGARRGPGGIGLIAPNPNKGIRFRNQVDQPGSTSSNGNSAIEPKYLSDKSRATASEDDGRDGTEDLIGAFAGFALYSNPGEAPHGYEELRIAYGGPRGVHDFDFG